MQTHSAEIRSVDELRVSIDRCFLPGTGRPTHVVQRRSLCIAHWTVWCPLMQRSESLLGHGVEFRTVSGSLSRWARAGPTFFLLAQYT